MPLYIEKINGDVDRPTNQPTNQQSEYRAICLFRKLENRKKADICNLHCSIGLVTMYFITVMAILESLVLMFEA